MILHHVWPLLFLFFNGHNAIWTSWAFLQIPIWLWAWPTSFGFESMLEGYVEHAKPKFWSKSAFLSPKSTCLGRYTFILDTLYLWCIQGHDLQCCKILQMIFPLLQITPTISCTKWARFICNFYFWSIPAAKSILKWVSWATSCSI